MPKKQHHHLSSLLCAACGLSLILGASGLSMAALAQSTAKAAIPESLRVEHEEIHSALEEATRAPGRVGAAAKDLARVLDPHFERENQIALPPLGLLAPLARGERPAETTEVLAMTDALKKELPRMLEEHKQIRAGVEKLLAASRAEKTPEFERLAEELAAHAQTEEEVLYPAAILVGEVIRGRMQGE